MTWNSNVKKAIDLALATKRQDKLAVFDADGTLWYDDLGEEFFEYQVTNKLAPGLRNIGDPWTYYRELEEKNPIQAYGWLAQINAGVEESQLREQGRLNYQKNFKNKIDSRMSDLVQKLQIHNFEVWICTASVKWAVEPALKDLKIPKNQIIGTSVLVNDKGILTDKVVKPVPYGPGKKEWLQNTFRFQPNIVVGNSMGDIDMLGIASELPLVICFQPHRIEIEESEKRLLVEAEKLKWPVQIFHNS